MVFETELKVRSVGEPSGGRWIRAPTASVSLEQRSRPFTRGRLRFDLPPGEVHRTQLLGATLCV